MTPDLSWIVEQLRPLAVPIETLNLDPENARVHPERNLDEIRKSFIQFGQRLPVVVQRSGMIVRSGNGRLVVARSLGWTHLAAVITDDTDLAAKTWGLIDNASALSSTYDDAQLAKLLAEIRIDPALLDVSGFSSAEVKALLAPARNTSGDPDAPPPVIHDPVTSAGDIWRLGHHTLLCGDATSRDDVARALGGNAVDICITDPPYGIGETSSKKNKYISYEDTEDNLKRLVAAFLPLAMERAKRAVITPGNGNQAIYPPPNWTMAWFVPAGVGRGPWGFCCWQPILCYGTDPKLASGKGCHPDAVSMTVAAETATGHPCPKPAAFWAWLIERCTESGQTIFDPFAGSGTSFVAASQTGRACVGIEISPAYCDGIVRRWETFTGQKAVRNPPA